MKYTRSIALFVVLALVVALVSSCGNAGGTGGGGSNVVVLGSTSVQPFIEVLAAEYERDFSGSPVDVQGGGSSMGINTARDGIADIGMSSRSLRGEELELEYVTIALDGLALIVHPDNPVSNLSLEQIRRIYMRYYTNWSQLGGEDGAIHVVTREEGSGTRGAFEELVMNCPYDDCDGESCYDGTKFIHPRTIVLNTNGAIRQFVTGNRNAIGYISLGAVEIDGLPPVKGLSIDGNEPTAENVFRFTETDGGEGYGLFRPFVFIIGDDPTPETQAFVDFVLSPDGQEILVRHDLISILAEGAGE